MANIELDRAKWKLRELITAVVEMRRFQKLYFKYRTPDYLRQAKKFEKQVDAIILPETSKGKLENLKLF